MVKMTNNETDSDSMAGLSRKPRSKSPNTTLSMCKNVKNQWI